MNIYVKSFLHRGLVFGGFGPIVVGVVYAVLQNTLADFSLTGPQVCMAVISTYILAFLQAGATVFNQVEHWSVAKSLLCHFATLYASYTSCYLLNSWIPFKPQILLIFTAIFVLIYFFIWITVYLCVRANAKKLNSRLN